MRNWVTDEAILSIFNVPSTCAEASFCRVLTSAVQLSSAGQQSGAGGGAVNISEVKSYGSDNQTCKRCLTMFGMERTKLYLDKVTTF